MYSGRHPHAAGAEKRVPRPPQVDPRRLRRRMAEQLASQLEQRGIHAPAVLAAMGCTVFSLERMPELHEATRALLHSLQLGPIRTYCRDGTRGLPLAAPFERIIVTAGGPEVPTPLLDQLAEGGILVIPVGSRPRTQRLLRVHKRLGRTDTEDLGPVIFVDLVGDHGWRP
ncbi:MAG: hypothetical protein K2G99_06115 [Desulfovibrio sp.]|nr:hypothetical protein [Desulfovibrio sp.]